MNGPFANLPSPPYFAVIFSSTRTAGENGCDAMADRMMELAAEQAGFLGVESARGADGFSITVSYRARLEAFKAHAEHRIAQETGKTRWSLNYELRVARVERAYGKRGD